MKILITAPAGWVGSRIVRELLAPEFSVRVLTRNPDRLRHRAGHHRAELDCAAEAALAAERNCRQECEPHGPEAHRRARGALPRAAREGL